jgi:hypothetical protein
LIRDFGESTQQLSTEVVIFKADGMLISQPPRLLFGFHINSETVEKVQKW